MIIVSIILTLVSLFAMVGTIGLVGWMLDLRPYGGRLWMTFVMFLAVVWLFGWALSIPLWWGQGGEAFGL